MTTAKTDDCSLCEKIGFKSFTRENIFSYYIPGVSLVSYAGLSVNVMNPPLAARLVPKKDITNILLACTLFGSAVYLYNSPHIKSLIRGKRLAVCTVGSILFSMGSVLLWAIIRSGIPRNAALSTILGLASGGAIVKISTDYFDYCNKAINQQ